MHIKKNTFRLELTKGINRRALIILVNFSMGLLARAVSVFLSTFKVSFLDTFIFTSLMFFLCFFIVSFRDVFQEDFIKIIVRNLFNCLLAFFFLSIGCNLGDLSFCLPDNEELRTLFNKVKAKIDVASNLPSVSGGNGWETPGQEFFRDYKENLFGFRGSLYNYVLIQPRAVQERFYIIRTLKRADSLLGGFLSSYRAGNLDLVTGLHWSNLMEHGEDCSRYRSRKFPSFK